MLWRKNNYYCTNIENCQRALNDYAYSESEYQVQSGYCTGTESHPCNAKLTLGKSRLRYETIFFVFGLASIAAVVLSLNYNYLFPTTYKGIGFLTAHSEINETETTLEIPVQRQDSVGEIAVEFQVNAISATPNSDFVAENGTLIFPSGQEQIVLSVPILEDSDFKEGREIFSIQLMNVAGLPTHQVIILDAPLPKEQISKAEALIKQQSSLAADLAGYVKKELVLRKAIIDMPPNSSTRDIFISQLSINQGNLSRARDAYISGFNTLKTIDQNTVFSTLDNWLASLKRQSMAQQYQATMIMKDQYQRYADNNMLEMDIWLNELLNAIPGEESMDEKKPFMNI